MDFRKLLNINLSPKDNFESFLNQIKKMLEKESSYDKQKTIISIAIEIFRDECEPTALFGEERDDYGDKQNKLFKLESYYSKKNKLDNVEIRENPGKINNRSKDQVSTEEELALPNTYNVFTKITWQRNKQDLIALFIALQKYKFIPYIKNIDQTIATVFNILPNAGKKSKNKDQIETEIKPIDINAETLKHIRNNLKNKNIFPSDEMVQVISTLEVDEK